MVEFFFKTGSIDRQILGIIKASGLTDEIVYLLIQRLPWQN
jgi:hypothetical protein